VLNLAFDLAMMDLNLNDMERVELCILRQSWGNWYPYAVLNTTTPTERLERMNMPPEIRTDVHNLLRGQGPCPLCKKSAAAEPHRIFRWHRRCVAMAFAKEAAELGNDEQQKWAAEVIGHQVPPTL